MLSKETGVLAIVAVMVWLSRQKRYRLAAALGSSLLPAIAWYLYVQNHTVKDYATSGFRLLSPFFVSFTLPLERGIVPLVFRVAMVIAVAGMLWAAARGIFLGITNRFHDLETLLCFLFAVLVILFQDNFVWGDPDGFTRVYSPLLVCLIAATWRKGFGQTLASFAMVTCPLVLQLGGHLVWPVMRTLMGD